MASIMIGSVGFRQLLGCRTMRQLRASGTPHLAFQFDVEARRRKVVAFRVGRGLEFDRLMISDNELFDRWYGRLAQTGWLGGAEQDRSR
jgi:hypothetical protein